MSNSSLFVQVGMIIVAAAVFITYIKPTYADIQATRDATAMYITEADKVKSVDDMLAEKAAKVDMVSAADTSALKRYVPDSVDDMEVMKDIRSIFTALAIPLSGLTANVGQPALLAEGEIVNTLATHSFTISASMTYDELKVLLKALEVNNYLLQVDTLKITPEPTGQLTIAMTLSTFSRATAVPVSELSEDNPST